jgi:hypothetical protein
MKYINKNSEINAGELGYGYGLLLTDNEIKLLCFLFMVGLSLILIGGLFLGGKTCRTDVNLESVKCKTAKWLLWSGYATVGFPGIIFFGPTVGSSLGPLIFSLL